ncbi:hypothetical protein EV421DRAFT_1744085 [Armillaria borealis]|uniref:NAD(P)-binding protein n=1 Tax=Armillaria borealis TaxID=47425 RepID=A0AA39ITY3_9AGAR|nr:hypothetical protein EV421DRAFT_1744085 [Armillaria borealis]
MSARAKDEPVQREARGPERAYTSVADRSNLGAENERQMKRDRGKFSTLTGHPYIYDNPVKDMTSEVDGTSSSNFDLLGEYSSRYQRSMPSTGETHDRDQTTIEAKRDSQRRMIVFFSGDLRAARSAHWMNGLGAYLGPQYRRRRKSDYPPLVDKFPLILTSILHISSTSPMLTPTSKGVAVVTGAAQGIGKAINLRLADNGFEPRSSRKAADAVSSMGDVSNEEDVKSMIEGVVNTLGGLDVTQSSNEIAYLLSTPVGRSSATTIKSPIRGLTQGTALDLGKYGITVNAYAPVHTEMSDSFHPYDLRASVFITVLGRETAHQEGNMEEVIKMNVARSAVDYVVQPEDIAGLVSYLASKEARYMIGQTVGTVDGAFTNLYSYNQMSPPLKVLPRSSALLRTLPNQHAKALDGQRYQEESRRRSIRLPRG